MKSCIGKMMKRYKPLFENDDYRGVHQAPTNNGYNAPLYDVSNIYPQDIYTDAKAYNYYGHGENKSLDMQAVNIVREYHNKPNGTLTIYRAVPDTTKEDSLFLNALNKVMKNYYKFRHIASSMIKNHKEAFNFVETLYDDMMEKYDYDEAMKKCVEVIDKKRDELSNNIKQSKLKINKGDWVTTVKAYAVEHGISQLNGEYTILSKKVKAKELWTDGNSIFEWGYSK